MFKRVTLFFLTNILVIATLSILASLLGVGPYLSANGLNYGALMVFCLFWGMGGSFISLLMSRQMAKWMTGVKVIQPESAGEYHWLVQKVHDLSRKAGISVMPEVGIYQSPEINAFATGPTKNRALVAVSTGLLQRMNQDQLDGVLGHEVAHIQNGDMVTMTLIQGVVNAFTMFLSRIIAFFVTQNMREESRAMYRGIITVVLDIALGMLGFMVVCWFSRQREFRADRGSANLWGGEFKMVEALRGLMRQDPRHQEEQLAGSNQQALAVMKISGHTGGLMSLFSTHPPLSERIAALGAKV